MCVAEEVPLDCSMGFAGGKNQKLFISLEGIFPEVFLVYFLKGSFSGSF